MIIREKGKNLEKQKSLKNQRKIIGIEQSNSSAMRYAQFNAIAQLRMRDFGISRPFAQTST
jgi:hypothetical protein